MYWQQSAAWAMETHSLHVGMLQANVHVTMRTCECSALQQLLAVAMPGWSQRSQQSMWVQLANLCTFLHECQSTAC